MDEKLLMEGGPGEILWLQVLDVLLYLMIAAREAVEGSFV
jgi:hypothetical protein